MRDRTHTSQPDFGQNICALRFKSNQHHLGVGKPYFLFNWKKFHGISGWKTGGILLWKYYPNNTTLHLCIDTSKVHEFCLSIYVSVLNSVCGLPRATTMHNIDPLGKCVKCLFDGCWDCKDLESSSSRGGDCVWAQAKPAEWLSMTFQTYLCQHYTELHITKKPNNRSCGLSQLSCKMLLLLSQGLRLCLSASCLHTTHQPSHQTEIF